MLKRNIFGFLWIIMNNILKRRPRHMYYDNFAARLSKLRQEKGVSARDMSLSLGQSESYINKIENNYAMPSMNGFFYICEYLGVTPAEFFNEEQKNPVVFNELINNLKSLNENQLKLLSDFIKSL